MLPPAHECVSEAGKHECKATSGQCVVERDGYYVVSAICIVVGVTLWLAFVRPTALKLQGELKSWVPDPMLI
jgi:MFS transporter, PAT family, solute carrier family 33 (acetyl-CoA transportor), member 1